MAGVALLVIAPWTVRNWLVHGEPVFIKSTFGYAFWQGNSPGSWGTDKVPKAGPRRPGSTTTARSGASSGPSGKPAM